jgi:hypothetical protein
LPVFFSHPSFLYSLLLYLSLSSFIYISISRFLISLILVLFYLHFFIPFLCISFLFNF